MAKRILAVAVFLAAVPPIFAQTPAAGDLAWDDAVKILKEFNPQKIQSRFDIKIYTQKALTAKAGLFPTVALTGAYNKDRLAAYGYPEDYNYGTTASQPLYSPATTAGFRKAQSDLEGIRAQDALLDSQLFGELRKAFARLVFAQELSALSEQIIKRRQENVELIRLKYKSGLESNAALLETEALLSAAEWDHDKDLRELTIAGRRVNQLLGRRLVTPVSVSRSFAVAAPAAEFAEFAPRLTKHPLMRVQEAALAGAKENKNTAKSEFLPTANAVANYNWQGLDWPSNGIYWNYGLAFNWPVFSGGKSKADFNASVESISRAQTQISKTQDELYLAAETNFMAWREAASYVDLSKKMLDASEARSWLVHNQYLSGRAGYFEWRDAESQLISYQKQLLSAKRDLAVSYAEFLQSLGRGE